MLATQPLELDKIDKNILFCEEKFKECLETVDKLQQKVLSLKVHFVKYRCTITSEMFDVSPLLIIPNAPQETIKEHETDRDEVVNRIKCFWDIDSLPTTTKELGLHKVMGQDYRITINPKKVRADYRQVEQGRGPIHAVLFCSVLVVLYTACPFMFSE